MKIVSGGQTGADRAALDAAIELGLPHGGWCPKGRLAEDGAIAPRYLLVETESPEYEVRTEWNVRDSDGTIVLTFGEPKGGSAYTVQCAETRRRPWLCVDLRRGAPVETIRAWIDKHGVQTLNVAGSRESQSPGIYGTVKALLLNLFASR